jgi:glycosyltransferase involved in cell wall biosynthesis
MDTLSVVISAKNEEAKLPRVLESVMWANEIVVVDSESQDKTSLVAKKYGARVVRKKNNLMLNVNKNFGFSLAKSQWILCLDADEVIPDELTQEIKAILSGPQTDIQGYWISRKNIIFGKWIQHGLWWPDKQLRLFRKGKGKFPQKHVHEYLEVEGKVSTLSTPYIHYNYETISQYIHKMDEIYTENEVQNLRATNYPVVWYDAIRFPVSDFLKVYFSQEGYKDGLHGLVLSMLQGMYSFIVFAKLWEKDSFSEKNVSLPMISAEFRKSAKDMCYWEISSRIKQSENPPEKLLMRLIRKLRYS